MTTDCHVSISLDGYLAGPDQSLDAPVGVGGERLHTWHWKAEASGSAADVAATADLLAPRGAYVMGRNMFGPVRGPWSSFEARGAAGGAMSRPLTRRFSCSPVTSTKTSSWPAARRSAS